MNFNYVLFCPRSIPNCEQRQGCSPQVTKHTTRQADYIHSMLHSLQFTFKIDFSILLSHPSILPSSTSSTKQLTLQYYTIFRTSCTTTILFSSLRQFADSHFHIFTHSHTHTFAHSHIRTFAHSHNRTVASTFYSCIQLSSRIFSLVSLQSPLKHLP
jgi:hypothetical protein